MLSQSSSSPGIRGHAGRRRWIGDRAGGGHETMEKY
uniref:Uncharacterized protein n=1 Tax=Anopheles albimanus TaxID=7167 RepID=A0A182FZ06_ANOAL